MTRERVFYRDEFCMDLSGERFSGYTDDDTWNGFACPYFTYGEAGRLLNEFGNRWEYDQQKDAFIVWALGSSEDDEPEIFESVTIQANGEEVKVYGIGAYSWIWDTCE